MAQIGIFSPVAIPQSKAAPLTLAIDTLTPPASPSLIPRTISELISHRARQFPERPILGYPSQSTDYVEYTYSQLDRFTTQAAQHYAQHIPCRLSSEEPERIVALLGLSNLDYLITALALSRLGFTVLFLSTRISETAYVSLLEVTDCSWIVCDTSTQRTVSGLQSHLTSLYACDTFNILEPTSVCQEVELDQTLDLSTEANKISWIIHSSGSTGLPKPIYQTHSAALRNYENNMDMEGFITLPLFHAHGLSSVFRAVTSNKKIFMYNASLPLTTESLLTTMRKYTFEIFYGVPYALKLLSETPDGVHALAAMKIVMFGGSACPDALGDLLVNARVNLISHYGTTETGQLMTSIRPETDKAWNFVRVHDKLAPFIEWNDRGDNLHELVVLDGWPSKVASNRDDGAYATKDLFERHPTLSNAWKYAGRLDDTIVLMNGEKAIPIATEQAVRQNKYVKDAIMFGNGKAQLGMMIVASAASAHMSSKEIIDAIWPAIEKENKVSPAYAQLSPDMIEVLSVDTTYPQTDKGTLIRQAFYRAFQQEIEGVYQRVEVSKGGSLVLEGSDLRLFLREQLAKIMLGVDIHEISDSTDLFSLGVDSLQATRLRSSLLHHLELNGNPLSQNVVFENPTIDRLANVIVAVREGGSIAARNVEEEMAHLVSKYSTFPDHVPQARTSSRRCIVLTGATGSLGAHIAAQLAARDDVDEICCLVRASSDSAAKRRVHKSMRERAVFHTLNFSARRKITTYSSDFSKPKLGISDVLYLQLSQDITELIHCAWSVNFNKGLSSFEADCIAGARNLLLLCLAAKQEIPASFSFCSSVSTVVNTAGNIVPEALPQRFACAQGMGYAQSKLVTENIISRAAATTGMRARVLRIGQIVADTEWGIWNDTEAIPLMLQSAVTVGALPALDETPRWLPVDVVARTVLDTSLSSTSESFFNIVNPLTFHWTRDLLPALRTAGLNFETIDQQEWISRLRASDPDPSTNPTIKLVEFFASKYDNNTTKKQLGYETAIAESLSPALASRPRLTQDLVDKFINHFLRTSWKPSLTALTTAPLATRPTTKHLFILSGTSSSSSSVYTIATLLGKRLKCTIIDKTHDRMISTDDSWPARLRTQIIEQLQTTRKADVILTCPTLGRDVRTILRDMVAEESIEVYFVPSTTSTEAQDAESDISDPTRDEVDVFPVDLDVGAEEVVEEIVECLL